MILSFQSKEVPMNLGEQIYRLRTQHNMSQGDLADALDVSRQSVSKWENNNAVPDLDKLIRISDLFGITLDELIRSTPPSPNGNAAIPEVTAPPAQFPTRKLTGILLLICGILCFAVPTMLGEFLLGYMIGGPLAIVGGVLAFSERDFGLRIFWLLFATLYPLMSVFGYNFVRFDITSSASIIFILLLSVLVLATFRKFRQGSLSTNTKRIIAASLVTVVLFSFLFSSILIRRSEANELLTGEAEIEMVTE